MFEKLSGRRWMALVALIVLAVIALFRCGGGGGGDGTRTEFSLSGDVTVPNGTTRQGGGLDSSPLANATVKAYFWPDLNNPIGQAQTDENGHYTLLVSTTTTTFDRDIVLVAEKTVGNQTVRVTAIAGDVPREGKIGVNLNATTTLTAEEVIKAAKELNIQDLSPNVVASIADQIHREVLEDLTSLDLTVNGPLLPVNLGDGLKDGQITTQVRQIVERQRSQLQAPTGDIAIAKGIVQRLRDFGVSLVDIYDTEAMNIKKAIDSQQHIIEQEVINPTKEFLKRVNFPARVLGLRIPRVTGRDLIGLAPGKYEERTEGLVRVGDAPDDKTWIVESKLPDTLGMTLNVTVQTAIPKFDLDPAAGKYTVTVTKAEDTALNYTGTLEVTERDTQNDPTRVALNLSFRDKDLTTPLTVALNITGTISRGRAELPPYIQMIFGGSIRSQFGSFSASGWIADWFADTRQGDRLKKVNIGAVHVLTSTTKIVSVSSTDFVVEFNDESPPQYPHVTPKRATIGSLLIEGEELTLELTDVKMGFARKKQDGEVIILPRTVEAKINYTSPNLTLEGNIDGSWDNPVPGIDPGDLRGPLEDFPSGSLTLNGELTPKIGRPSNVNITITTTPTRTPPKVALALTLGHGDQYVIGNVSGEIPVDRGQVTSNKLRNVTGDITHSPSNLKLEIRPKETGSTEVKGQIKKIDGTVLADIGKASELGLPDLGDVFIIKYTDNTFETLPSTLPTR